MLLFLGYPCMGMLIMIRCFIVLVYSYNLIIHCLFIMYFSM